MVLMSMYLGEEGGLFKMCCALPGPRFVDNMGQVLPPQEFTSKNISPWPAKA